MEIEMAGEWVCESCTLINSNHGQACAVCGQERKIVESSVKTCPACTFHNGLNSTICVVCGEDLKVNREVKGTRQSISFYTGSIKRRQLSSLALKPTSSGSITLSLSPNKQASQSLANKINVYDVDKHEDKEDGLEESESGSEDTIDDFSLETESCISIDGDVEEESIENSDEFAVDNLDQPSPIANLLPSGVVEIAPTFPNITKHYWSVKHVTSLKVCAINFNDFTLDAGTVNPNNTKAVVPKASARNHHDYDRRRRAREVKESKTKKSRSRGLFTRKAKGRAKKARKGGG